MNQHVRERAIFVQSTPAFLTRLDDMIEELIAMRDALDGDQDLEDGHDAEEGGDLEPLCGWTDRQAASARYGESDPSDAEIGLNELGAYGSQDMPRALRGALSCDDDEDGFDREIDVADEPHDREPDEPSLGWTDCEAALNEYVAPLYVDAELDD